jgi:hypothetical protein
MLPSKSRIAPLVFVALQIDTLWGGTPFLFPWRWRASLRMCCALSDR